MMENLGTFSSLIQTKDMTSRGYWSILNWLKLSFSKSGVIPKGDETARSNATERVGVYLLPSKFSIRVLEYPLSERFPEGSF